MPERPGRLPAALATSTLLQGLSGDERAEVLRYARPRLIQRKDVLFRQGEPATVFFVVESGRIKLTQLTADGQEVIIRFLGPGELFAGVVALKGGTYPATAQAVETTRLLGWSKQTLDPLVDRVPQLKTNIMQAMSEHMREALERFRELATERVPQRVARTLLRLARQAGRQVEDGVLLDQVLSRQELAEMTGTTLFTVSRILSQWQAQSIVQSGRERILIRSLDRLTLIAEDARTAEE